MNLTKKNHSFFKHTLGAGMLVSCFSPILGQDLKIKGDMNDLGLSGKVEARHVYDEIQVEGSDTKRSPRIQFTPVLGAKAFEGRVNLSLKGSFDRLTETTALKQREQAELKASLATMQFGDFFKLTPAIKHKFAGSGKDSSTKLFSSQTIGFAFVSPHGLIEPGIAVEAGTQVHGRDQKTTYLVDDSVADSSYEGLGLTRSADDESKLLGKKTAQSFYHEWALGVKFTPSQLKNLTVELGAVVEFAHDPEYKVNASKQLERNYQAMPSSVEHIGLAYKINNQVSLKNDFYRFQDGFFAESAKVGAKTISNELQISYNLF